MPPAGGDSGAGTSKAAKAKAAKVAMKDFLTEYAKSGAAKCRKCEEKILKVIIDCFFARPSSLFFFLTFLLLISVSYSFAGQDNS